MIKKCRPVLFVENDRVEKSDELISLVKDLGYNPYWHVCRLFNEANHNGEKEDIFGWQSSYDMLCLPGRECDLPPAVVGEHPLTKPIRMVA